MVNFRPILLVTGILLVTLSLAMLVCGAIDLMVGSDEWRAFFVSAFFTSFTGGAFILANQGKTKNLSLKQAFILTTFSWVALTSFAAFPFMLSNINISFTDAFFESMSGLTTTGSTVITGLDNLPPGILLWRAILQWLGGIGIIVLAMAVLPMLKIGGMQLFRTESSEKSDKILPRAAQIAGAIGGLYITLTIMCATCLWFAGMSIFDAICHAMTTISTAGFSTHDASISYYNNIMIEMVMALFMLMGATPFVLFIQLFRGHPEYLWRDNQVKWFLSIVAISVTGFALWLHFNQQLAPLEAARYSIFNIISIITTSGFSSADYNNWGSIITPIFILSVMGGCMGSTTGGIKIFRFQVLYETAKAQIYQLIQPHGVFRPLFNNKPITESVSSAVLSFFILFAFCFTVLAFLLSLTGLDYITSMSAAASHMANVGPGLGDIVGPSGNYSSLSDFAKWALAVGMIVGRLEIFTVLVLLTPVFWRN